MRREDFGIGTLFDKVRDAVIVAEAASGRVVLWNPAASRVFGYPASEARGMLVEALVPQDLKERHRAGLARYGETGRGPYVESEEYLELPAVKKGGEEIRVELSLNPVDLEGGEGVGGRYVLAVVRDATRRKQAEEELRRHAEEVADLYNNAPCGYHSLDEEGTFIAINDTELAWLGYAREEVVGRKKFSDMVTGRSLRTFRENYPLFKEQGWIADLEFELVRKDGTLMWVLLSATALKDAEGNFLASRSTCVDVTDRRRAEETRAALSAIVEASDDAILGKTLDGIITSWNRGAENIYGYSAEEVVGKPIAILVAPDRQDEIPTILQKVGRGERVEHYETERLRKDGDRIHVSITVSPIFDSADNIIGASTVARDITEHRRAEEEIRRLNEDLEERVAERTARLAERESQLKALVGKLVTAQEEERRRVAYEIHDGLTQVAIAAHQHLQIFADNHPPGSRVEPGELDRALSLAQRVVREARHVIEGLRPTALDDFGLAAALRLMVEELREEGWKAAYEENLGPERLDPEAETGLYRVAQEALNNVRKHSGTREVSLRLALGEGKVRLEVEDRGRGFDPRAVKRDGRPGERVGLAGMRERIGLLGGELTIASTPGNGTCVAAEIPLEVTPETLLEDARKD